MNIIKAKEVFDGMIKWVLFVLSLANFYYAKIDQIMIQITK
jgi:hypothetical protein